MILCLPRLQILGVIRLGDLSSLMGPKKDINVQFVHIFFFSHCKDKNDNFQKLYFGVEIRLDFVL